MNIGILELAAKRRNNMSLLNVILEYKSIEGEMVRFDSSEMAQSILKKGAYYKLTEDNMNGYIVDVNDPSKDPIFQV